VEERQGQEDRDDCCVDVDGAISDVLEFSFDSLY
jgi:hypothetical protein